MRIPTFLSIVLCCTSFAVAQQTPVGTLKGRVLNRTTKAPLGGVSVVIEGTKKGAISNSNGEFSIAALPVGSYTVHFRLLGFEPLTEPDAIIRSQRTTFLEKELAESVIALEEVTVHSGYFRSAAVVPASTMEMGAEELRRAPGSAGDVNRALYALPSVVQADDEANDLVVRGGAPFENGYYIDNIFTPNINHFPQQGASGGNIAMLNIDFIQDVSMLAGGFDASYGNRLSAVVDIQLREGNRDAYDAQIDMNMTGFGGSIEGPISSDGAFMFSAKHSYFDLIVDQLKLGVAPTFYDAQGKVNYDLGSHHKLTLLDVFGKSEFERDRDKARELDEGTFGKEQYTQNTVGINWRALWGESGYSNTAFSYASLDGGSQWFNTITEQRAAQNSYIEKFYTLRHSTVFQLDRERSVEFGGEWQQHSLDGFVLPGEQERHFALGESTAGVFVTAQQSLWERFSVQLGVRAAYFSEGKRVFAEPRLKLSYMPSDVLSLYAAYGVLHQALPLFLKAYTHEKVALSVPEAQHYILGMKYLFSDDIQLTVEGYAKEYRGFPLVPDHPTRFVVDDVVGDDSEFDYYRALVSGGEAYTRGVEVLLQKKLVNHFYGIVGASYFRSQYRDLTETWRNRLFDNQIVFTFSAGWKPNDEWEVSLRWVYAGGKAYTPIDVGKARQQGWSVLDASRIMGEHYPAYHSLNLRVDKRFYFMNTNLILYASVLNAYNRENVRNYYWDSSRQQIRQNSMLPVIPILGVEFEF